MTVGDDYYGPTKLTVKKNTTIKWVWLADNSDSHDVKLLSGPKGFKKFHSGPAASDYTFSKKLTKLGIYKFICTLHQDMRMTIKVHVGPLGPRARHVASVSAMSDSPSRELHLVSRPNGWPTPDNFELVDAPAAEPADGEVLVRNMFISVDPYMRGRMNDVKSYVAAVPARPGAATAARSARSSPPTRDGLAVGDPVAAPARLARVRVVDADARVRQGRPDARAAVAPTSACSACPGLTAYVGLLESPALQARRHRLRLRRGRRGRLAWSARSPSSRAPPA